MKGKHSNDRLTIRWNTQVKIILILMQVIIFVAGATIGVFIAKVTSAEEPSPEPITTENATSETSSTLPTPTNTYYDCPLSEDLQDYIRNQCEENDIPMSVVIAMIEVESSFRADVISKTNDYGLMQINKCNHDWLSEKYGITDFLDPYQNVYCGIKILSNHYKNYGDLDKALMAYNMGATGAKRYWNIGIYKNAYTERIRTAMEEYEGV